MRRGDPPPTVVRCSKFAPRTLFSIFFKSNGPVFIHRVEREQTIDHHYYIITSTIVYDLLLMKSNVKDPHMALVVLKFTTIMESHMFIKMCLNYLESEGLTIILHPSNSLDISPCDFWLFDLINENLTDQSDSQSLYDAVIDFMYSLNKEEYRKTFEKWIEKNVIVCR